MILQVFVEAGFHAKTWPHIWPVLWKSSRWRYCSNV